MHFHGLDIFQTDSSWAENAILFLDKKENYYQTLNIIQLFKIEIVSYFVQLLLIV